jgi:hypothetical protein
MRGVERSSIDGVIVPYWLRNGDAAEHAGDDAGTETP